MITIMLGYDSGHKERPGFGYLRSAGGIFSEGWWRLGCCTSAAIGRGEKNPHDQDNGLAWKAGH